MSNPQPSTPARPTGAAAPGALLVRSAARWFWWIAGLSVINIVMFQTGTKTSFVVGLGITALSDAMFVSNKPVGFVIDAIVVGFFAWIGWQAAQARLWAFYLGLAVYAVDALIYVNFKAWMPVAFHVLVIFFIFRGVMLLRRIQQATG